MKNRKAILSLVIMLFVASIIMATVVGCGNDDSDRSIFEYNTPTPGQKSWTFLVYMAADNNLEYAGLDDVDEMEAVGSTDDVNIVVQFDRSGQYDSRLDWSGCRRYYITKNDESGVIGSTLIQDMGNVDTGDYNQFVSFVEWGITNYPADNYAVVMWNHGSGWKMKNKASRVICQDETSGDEITENQIRTALGDINTFYGQKLELVAMDACLMGGIETAYDVKDYANYLAFSQTVVPGDGYPYTTILGDLTGNPSMDGSSLANSMVVRYGEYYSNMSSETEWTESAFNMSKMDTLITAVNNFSTIAENVMEEEKPNFLSARENTTGVYIDPQYPDSYSDYKDLYLYMSNLKALSNDANVQSAATQVQNALLDARIAVVNGSEATIYNAAGLNIWIPDEEQYTSQYESYNALAFGSTEWYTFVGLINALTD